MVIVCSETSVPGRATDCARRTPISAVMVVTISKGAIRFLRSALLVFDRARPFCGSVSGGVRNPLVGLDVQGDAVSAILL